MRLHLFDTSDGPCDCPCHSDVNKKVGVFKNETWGRLVDGFRIKCYSICCLINLRKRWWKVSLRCQLNSDSITNCTTSDHKSLSSKYWCSVHSELIIIWYTQCALKFHCVHMMINVIYLMMDGIHLHMIITGYDTLDNNTHPLVANLVDYFNKIWDNRCDTHGIIYTLK